MYHQENDLAIHLNFKAERICVHRPVFYNPVTGGCPNHYFFNGFRAFNGYLFPPGEDMIGFGTGFL